eukprot:240188-Pleurochrysis_carterae.AAC.1
MKKSLDCAIRSRMANAAQGQREGPCLHTRARQRMTRKQCKRRDVGQASGQAGGQVGVGLGDGW